MVALVSTAAALSFSRLRPLLVGFMLLTLVLVQTMAMHRVAHNALHVHKCYNHHDVVAEFAERLTLDGPPAALQVPVLAQAYERPTAVLFSSFEGFALNAALPRAPPAHA